MVLTSKTISLFQTIPLGAGKYVFVVFVGDIGDSTRNYLIFRGP
jgi:hypothetical protein